MLIISIQSLYKTLSQTYNSTHWFESRKVKSPSISTQRLEREGKVSEPKKVKKLFLSFFTYTWVQTIRELKAGNFFDGKSCNSYKTESFIFLEEI